ncbi:ankyrin repeat, PH and SEC7 domain containing protein secG isoform X1 [Hydra vulgaris]|uniref:Ankyrin repeat, PH and SEC7 domain containing protein secG isoform X1 n=1 Tax=Hydra vulgaris TaxID=6087 RepID=A0ABM4CCH7_HYDVU
MNEKEYKPHSESLHRAIAKGDRAAVEKLLNDGIDADCVLKVDEEILETAQRKSIHLLGSHKSMQKEANQTGNEMEEELIEHPAELKSTRNNRKSLADCIDERLQDGNEILIERSVSVVKPPDDVFEDLIEEKSMKLIPRIKKKISFKKPRKNIKKDEVSDIDDYNLIIKTRNVDDEQLSENYEGVAFFDAVRDGMDMIVQVLLETSNNYQLNLPDENGFTPVMQAAWHGQKECLIILLEHGANTNLRNATGCTASHFAAGQGHLECLEILIKYDPESVNAKTKFGATPLILASKDGHSNVVEFLLKNNADPNIQYRGKQNALLFAAGNGHSECIQHLLQHKVNLDQANSQNVTPLMRAVQQGHNECVTLLAANGADLNLQDITGRTALHFAVETNNTGALKILLNAGANYNLKTKGGSTPLSYAERNANKCCEEIIINHINVAKEKEKTVVTKELQTSLKKEKETTKCIPLGKIFGKHSK